MCVEAASAEDDWSPILDVQVSVSTNLQGHSYECDSMSLTMPTLPGRLESLYINVYLYADTHTEANMQATAQPSSCTTLHT